jgi:signal transduction histidine kinase
VLVGAATGAVLVVASLLTISTYRHRSFVRAARREAELSLLPGPARFSPLRLDDLIEQYRRRGGFETVVMTDDRTVASSPALPPTALPRDFADRVPVVPVGGTGDGLEQVETTVGSRSYLLLGGTPAAGVKVFFFFPLADLHRGVREFAVVLLLGWAVAVLASAAFGNLVARRALRPVRAAADASQALAEGLLETRLPPASDDEFGQWADAFNRMADALAAKIDALSQSQDRERRFTSDVAHELRTPLAAMVSAAGMLGEELDTLPASARPPAALLVKDVSRLSDLVIELLELARLDAGQESLHLERLRLGDALSAVSRAWSGEDQPIVLDVDPDLAVHADRARFRRVVSNIVSNAVRHGGGDVTIRAHRSGAVAAIEVTDRGPGLRPESLDRIFDRFHKEDTARSAAGSGLGLAIALEHARAQGGDLRAANRPGGGACFTFTLPAAAARPEPGDVGASASAAPRHSDRAATRATPPSGG